MQKTPVFPPLSEFPEQLQSYLHRAVLYDSSSSPEAQVWFIDKGEGFYLKRAARNTLKTEADMIAYFHRKGIGVELLLYLSLQQDWMLTRRAAGEDCTHAVYLTQPLQLCDILAQQLRALHELSFEGCPVPDHTSRYLRTAQNGCAAGNFDTRIFLFDDTPRDAAAAYAFAMRNAPLLQRDCLIHGDYCLPNIILDNWHFSAFIDLAHGGVGDRHIDLYWGAWSLAFNLGSTKYTDRFLDAYGRDRVDLLRLRTVSCMERFG